MSYLLPYFVWEALQEDHTRLKGLHKVIQGVVVGISMPSDFIRQESLMIYKDLGVSLSRA